MKKYFVIEACYHTSHLIGKLKPFLSGDDFGLIVRDNKQLDLQTLTAVHEKLQGKKYLVEAEWQLLREAYCGISPAEEELIKLHGIPASHILSVEPDFLVKDLNRTESLKNGLTQEAMYTDLAAIVFLDCLLKPWWLDVFKERVVNAHSAVLPYTRGMFAIEQIAANNDANRFIKGAGATLHYIDNAVDVGRLIKTHNFGDNVWNCDNIFQVKAKSYLAAFDLITEYAANGKFDFHDWASYKEDMGPCFRAKEFTEERRQAAETNFLAMKNEYEQFERKSVSSPVDDLSLTHIF